MLLGSSKNNNIIKKLKKIGEYRPDREIAKNPGIFSFYYKIYFFLYFIFLLRLLALCALGDKLHFKKYLICRAKVFENITSFNIYQFSL